MNYSIKSSEVNFICKTFSNLEELHCHITKLDHLLSILKESSKLSITNIIDVSKDIYSWYEKNSSKLKVYIDFISIDGQHEDLLNSTDTD
jgi:hypothetical protein